MNGIALFVAGTILYARGSNAYGLRAAVNSRSPSACRVSRPSLPYKSNK